MPKTHVLQSFMGEDQPGVWSVEVIDRFGDGEMDLTIFYGLYSDTRARQSLARGSPSRPPVASRAEPRAAGGGSGTSPTREKASRSGHCRSFAKGWQISPSGRSLLCPHRDEANCGDAPGALAHAEFGCSLRRHAGIYFTKDLATPSQQLRPGRLIVREVDLGAAAVTLEFEPVPRHSAPVPRWKGNAACSVAFPGGTLSVKMKVRRIEITRGNEPGPIEHLQLFVLEEDQPFVTQPAHDAVDMND
jgi:hypothetical protein